MPQTTSSERPTVTARTSRRPDDIEAWSGLILAIAELRGQAAGSAVFPETERSLYLAVLQAVGTAPDPKVTGKS